MTRRDINWVLLMKGAWVAANLTIWLLGLGTCITEPECWLAGNSFLPILFLLSFPGSIFFLIFNGAFIDSGIFVDVSPSMRYTFFSLAALTVGYIQWFHMVPAIFRKQEVTVLSLNQPQRTSTGKQETAPKRFRSPQVRVPQVQSFDNAGRSPLERVIDRKQRRRLTNVS